MATQNQTNDTLTNTIAAIADGKSYAARTEDRFCSIARRDGRYVVECGWAVPEGYDDDPGCCLAWPFRGGWRAMAWVGRATTTADPAEAARVYDEYRAVWDGRGPALAGERIGSVSREEG